MGDTSRIHIRPASARDVDIIAEFNIKMALETENHVLSPDRIQPGVAKVVADSRHGQYRVGEIDGVVAGALLVTYEWSDWRNGQFWWIQSVYVDPAYRRRGVYQTLYRSVRDECVERDDVVGLRLYVEKDNTNAQATYRKLGMSETHYLLYEEAFS